MHKKDTILLKVEEAQLLEGIKMVLMRNIKNDLEKSPNYILVGDKLSSHFPNNIG